MKIKFENEIIKISKNKSDDFIILLDNLVNKDDYFIIIAFNENNKIFLILSKYQNKIIKFINLNQDYFNNNKYLLFTPNKTNLFTNNNFGCRLYFISEKNKIVFDNNQLNTKKNNIDEILHYIKTTNTINDLGSTIIDILKNKK